MRNNNTQVHSFIFNFFFQRYAILRQILIQAKKLYFYFDHVYSSRILLGNSSIGWGHRMHICAWRTNVPSSFPVRITRDHILVAFEEN